jgi:hypothetical protein
VLGATIGQVSNGVIQLDEPGSWVEGQRVLVIALPAEAEASAPPPDDLLDEDAREFAPRRDRISVVNRSEL